MTRLETRTKESNAYASIRVCKTLECVVKAERIDCNSCGMRYIFLVNIILQYQPIELSLYLYK